MARSVHVRMHVYEAARELSGESDFAMSLTSGGIMKILLWVVSMAVLIASSSNAETNLAQRMRFSTTVVDFTAKALASEQLDAIALVALSKDMHLRMGYQDQVHAGELVLEALRLLPAYVVDSIYSRIPLPRFIFIFDEGNYFPDDPNTPREPFTRLPAYPDVPIIRLVFLKRENPLRCPLINRGAEPEFVAYAEAARQSGETLAEVMKFVNMEKLVNTNSVFSLFEWGSAFRISVGMVELPPIAKGEKLLLSDFLLTHVDDSERFSLPAAFADDLRKVAVEYKNRSSDGVAVDIDRLGLLTEEGRKLAEKVWPAPKPGASRENAGTAKENLSEAGATAPCGATPDPM